MQWGRRRLEGNYFGGHFGCWQPLSWRSAPSPSNNGIDFTAICCIPHETCAAFGASVCYGRFMDELFPDKWAYRINERIDDLIKYINCASRGIILCSVIVWIIVQLYFIYKSLRHTDNHRFACRQIINKNSQTSNYSKCQ